MSEPLYRATGLSRVHGPPNAPITALDEVSFAITEGDFAAVVGPSGSGKSTLLNLLGFLDRPTAGQLRFRGVDAQSEAQDVLARRRNREIGFVFQAYHLLPRNTALQNVMLPLLYAGVRRRERHERAASMLEQVGLKERMGHLPTQLSGGEQQRVAVARALVNKPAVLMADEPTGALDSATGEALMDLLAALNEQGITLVIVTHSDAVACRARSQIVLRDGRITHLNDRQIP